MSFQSVNAKAGKVAIVIEDVQGEPKAIASSTDFTAIQDDISLSPNFESADNAEQKNNIMAGKSIILGEAPQGSMSHYFRSSGVVGQAPDFGALLSCAMNNPTIVSVETTVDTGATVSSVPLVDATEYEKGMLLYVKSSTGIEVRPIASKVGNVVYPAFDFENVPTLGAGVGRSVTYVPANDALPTFSIYYILPNVTELMAGCRTTGVDITFPAKDLINASFSFEGTKFLYNPLVVDATNQSLDFDVALTEYSIQLPNKYYTTPIELADAIESLMNNAGSGVLFQVTYSEEGERGRFKIVGDGNFDLLWATGTNTATSIGGLIGFDTASDDTGASSYLADNQVTLDYGFTPSYDAEAPNPGKGNLTLLGSPDKNICIDADEVTFSLANTKTDLNSLCAENGVAASIISDRSVEVQITAYLEPFEADKYQSLQNNDTVSFFHACGKKSGGQFVEGSVAYCYLSHAVINNLELSQDSGVSKVTYTISAFAPDDSSQSAFIGFA